MHDASISFSSADAINKSRSAPSVLVIQMGARRGYELARMLESRGALAALHTSAAWPVGRAPSRLYRRLSGVSDGAVNRRTVHAIPPAKLHASFLPELVGRLVERAAVSTERRYRIEDWFLGLSARRAGLVGASVILNTSGNGGIGFLRWAKGQGARIATDIVITPRVYDILADERRRWPGWEDESDFTVNAEIYRRHLEKIVAVSDLLLSPSETVDDGLATVAGFDKAKLVRVPYGLGTTAIKPGVPTARRVLFAGQASLRKGLPYLAEAARLLRPDGYDIRVAGGIPPGVQQRAECQSISFLGHLGPDEMAAEFRSADVFCLPSLAEGMASVTLEALASGLPCVVTRAAGSPVRDGHDGLIVPERDGPAIADAIRAIAEDRPTRARMSDAALATASAHALDVVGDRLFAVLAKGARHGG